MDRSGSHPGAFAIVQAAAIDDTRIGSSLLRMLLALGIYRDAGGWCWPKQKQLADRLGITQQAVSKALRDLAALGYIEIHDQYDERTGARLSSRYRVVTDYALPVEFRRTPQPDVVGSQLEVVAPTTSEVVGPHNPGVVAPTTSEVVAIEEQPKVTTQRKQPRKLRSNERAPTSPSAQSRVIDLIREGGAEGPTFTGRDGKALKDTGADPETVSEAYLAAWRGDWDPGGRGFLRENLSVHAVVDRLDGFRVWRSEQAIESPNANGTSSAMTPATDDDRALWARALAEMRAEVSGGNFAQYIEPLEVAGRGEDNGLWLIVDPRIAEHAARFKSLIGRALYDAGDPNPGAVRFKARRARGREDGR